ncbi:hypothetical protein FQN57_005951, partial [Myotisia sp. PD_48]
SHNTTRTIEMRRPKEKDRRVPFNEAIALFNFKSGLYEKVKLEEKKPSPKPPVRKRGVSPTIFDKGYGRKSATAGTKRKRDSDDPSEESTSSRASSLLTTVNGRFPYVFNATYDTYERLTFDKDGAYDHDASSGRDGLLPRRWKGISGTTGPSLSLPPKRRRVPQTYSLEDWFKGLPLALKMRKE